MRAEQIIDFPTSRRMTPTDYERERDQIRETYGDSSRDAAAKSDQALAKLFYRSGWTQEELAKAEGKSQTHTSKMLRFGRFLDFSSMELKSETGPKNLSERRFRSYWERTDKAETNERIRFRAVLTLMTEETQLRRPLAEGRKLGEAIISAFADGEWHSLTAIAKRINAPQEDVQRHLDHWRNGQGAAKSERKQVGKSYSYRLFRKERQISSHELRQKLDPIIKSMFAASKNDIATISLSEMAHLARCLQRQLDEWDQ